MGDTTTLSLLNALYGGGSGVGAVGQGNPVTALTLAQATQTQQIATEAQQPTIARDIAQFTKAVGSATDAATLLKNPYVLNVLLTANGLGDQTAYPALAQKALLSNTQDSNSLADQLTDPNWKSTAATYDFANKGLSILQQPSVMTAITQGYAEVMWRQSLDATTPGLSNALTFISTAATTGTSVDAILGDSTLRTVVTTALGIPPQIAFQDLPAQEQAISSRLDVTQLQDPKFVQNMARQYLLQVQATDSTQSTSTPTLDQLAARGEGLVV